MAEAANQFLSANSESAEWQLCPYIDCGWKCEVWGEGWYICPHCRRPFFARTTDSDIEDWHFYRDGGPMGIAPESALLIAGSLGPSWATPKTADDSHKTD